MWMVCYCLCRLAQVLVSLSANVDGSLLFVSSSINLFSLRASMDSALLFV